MVDAFVVATYARVIGRAPKEHYYRSASSLITAIQTHDLPAHGEVKLQFFVDRACLQKDFDHDRFVQIIENLIATNPWDLRGSLGLKEWREDAKIALHEVTGGVLT